MSGSVLLDVDGEDLENSMNSIDDRNGPEREARGTQSLNKRMFPLCRVWSEAFVTITRVPLILTSY